MYWKLRKCTRCRPSLLLWSSLRLFIELLIGQFKGAVSRLVGLFILLIFILILKTSSFAMQINKLLVNDKTTARRVKQICFPSINSTLYKK